MKRTGRMKRIALSFIIFHLSFSPAEAQRLDWGDQQNGTYKNPVLNADYSDPDVIRVGDKYYMVASDFHFMGMQVLESDNLVNWQIVSQIYDRLDLPGWDQNAHYGGGSWTPAIRHHDGRFYVYFCTPDEGLFMSTATDAHGPWTALHCVKAVPKWEDPCPFWDDDGQAYLGRSQYGAGPIIIHRMSTDGRTLLDDGVTVYTGPVAEGTKFLKRDGYYYLIIPEGGVCCGWQTVLRSRSIYGPYEKRVVLEQGSTDVNGPHQGALVDTPDGTWWFFHFQETHPRGRVVHLQPARWTADGWPLIGVDIDGNGIGEPVETWTAPAPSNLPQLGEASKVTSAAESGAATSPQLGGLRGAGGLGDDSFSADHRLYWAGQQQRALGLEWQWCHNPVDSAWSLTERRGWLALHALPSPTLRQCRNMLTQKTVGYTSEATTRLDASALRNGDHAGLLCMGNRFMGIGVRREARHIIIYIEHDGQRTTIATCRKKTVYLRATIDSRSNQHQLSYSTDGHHFTPAGEPYALRMGSWKGSRVGLYCYHAVDQAQETAGTVSTPKATAPTGTAYFDFFHYDIHS